MLVAAIAATKPIGTNTADTKHSGHASKLTNTDQEAYLTIAVGSGFADIGDDA